MMPLFSRLIAECQTDLSTNIVSKSFCDCFWTIFNINQVIILPTQAVVPLFRDTAARGNSWHSLSGPVFSIRGTGQLSLLCKGML